MLNAIKLFLIFCALDLALGWDAIANPDACSPDRPARALVIAVRGKVLVFRGDGPASRLRLDAEICTSDRIVTGLDGAVEIRFVDSDTTIGGHTNTVILIPDEDDIDVSILGGLLRFVSSVKGIFSIRTPHQDGIVEGTEALVAVDGADQDTLILVRQGVVRARKERGDLFSHRAVSPASRHRKFARQISSAYQWVRE